MILRHTVSRQGRTALSRSTNQIRRTYATDINIDSPSLRQSNRDHQPQRSTPGHPDEASSLLSAVGHTSIPNTAPEESAVTNLEKQNDSLSNQVKALLAAQNGGAIPVEKRSLSHIPSDSNLEPASHKERKAIKAMILKSRKEEKELLSLGTHMTDLYHPWDIVQKPPKPADITLPMLLANQCHLGHATALWHPGNSSYIFGIRNGIHIISLEITLAYLRRAAKVVQEVARRGGIILFVGTRKNTREIVVNSAKIATPAYHIFSRWIPGSLTNGQQILDNCAIQVVNAKDEDLEQYQTALAQSSHAVLRPDLVVCLNPLENEVCLHECGLYNVPTIGIVDTDVNPSWVTYPIPANDDSPRSVALISGALARAAQEGQRLRLKVAEEEGRTTYSTKRVNQFLEKMEELSGLEVQDRGNGDRGKGDD